MSTNIIGTLRVRQTADSLDFYPEGDGVEMAEAFLTWWREAAGTIVTTITFDCDAECIGHAEMIFHAGGHVELAFDDGIDRAMFGRALAALANNPARLLCACGSHGGAL